MNIADIVERIENKKIVVGVVGLGYVGLPLCKEFVSAGVKTVGFDIDQLKIDLLKQGKTYIKHIPDELVAEMKASGLFSATSDFEYLKGVDALLVAVPTPLNKMREPELKYVEETAKAIGERLQKGQLVVLESTTYPGTTKEVVKPILERQSQLSLDAGEFFLAYSPEREDPGRKNFTTKTTPKVVGGYNQDSLDYATALYGLAVDKPIPVSSCEVAEASKILENTYRCVNIALVNELKMLFDRMGIDVWEVIEAASTKPFGFTPFYPGPGLGGHCIPIDPFYLTWKAREFEQPTRFIELAGEINTIMPEWVVDKVMYALNDQGKALKGSKILLLGMAYKADIDDDRESPSYKLMDLLVKFHAEVDYHDIHVPVIKDKREYPQFKGLKSVALTAENIRSYDCILISTAHTSVDYELVTEHAQLVVDTRNVCSAEVVKA